MSSMVIMGIAATALAIAFMAFFSITQTLERKREEQQRMLKALSYRANGLLNILAGFPPGFLPVELREHIMRSVLEIYHQLKAIDPASLVYREAFADCEKQLTAMAAEPRQHRQLPHVDNPAMLKEIRSNLKLLQNYLHQQTEQNRLTPAQTQQFEHALNDLQLQVTLDNYVHIMKQAQLAAKYPVAAHYCDLIVKALQKDGSAHHQGMLARYTEMYQQFVALTEQQNHPQRHHDDEKDGDMRGDLSSGIKKHNYD